jgi:hypothetical protein
VNTFFQTWCICCNKTWDNRIGPIYVFINLCFTDIDMITGPNQRFWSFWSEVIMLVTYLDVDIWAFPALWEFHDVISMFRPWLNTLTVISICRYHMWVGMLCWWDACMSCQLHDLILYHGVKEHRLYVCSLGWEDLNFTN